ncbi:PilN domain-containing protein [Vulcaniibacterium thermophilum]|uniref:Fimbrial protein n=1 Tax=Vulcaniibacterium thermophilum TaxID=1169913 RepID=A0A919D9P6_9GAMM|nr:PilN domain-containing protein [Vulcaniibacterium thermophilum]GHE30097.1 fimbrial protein [Vulcaniibacterium thermophilum]
MARINLLPWREERRKQRQKEFAFMLGASAVGAVLLTLLIWNFYGRQIDGQNERNQFLEAEIAKVEKQIAEIKELDEKKSKLLARKEIIEKLQANRSQMVHLFDSLVRTIPDGVVLTSIKQDEDTLTLEGRSQSNARVSTYLRNLESSGWMTKPDLQIIEATVAGKDEPKGIEKGLPYVFRLQVKLANPNNPDQDGDGEPDAPAAQSTAEGGAPADAPAAANAPAAAPASGAQPAPANPPAAPATSGSGS